MQWLTEIWTELLTWLGFSVQIKISSWSHPPLTNSIIFDLILQKPKVPITGIYHPSLTNGTILDWILQKPKAPNTCIYHPSVT